MRRLRATALWIGLGAFAAAPACGSGSSSATADSGSGSPGTGTDGPPTPGHDSGVGTSDTGPLPRQTGRDSGGSSGTGSGGGSGTDSGLAPGADATPGHEAGSTGSGSGSGTDGGTCHDTCPFADGVTVGCETRFLYGVNYAWKNWVADFGGVTAWSELGVSGNETAIQADLTDMKSHGVDVIRWWMLEQLEGDAVQFDTNGNITGAGGTLVADVKAALALAATVGVHYNFTIFSFDGFKPSATAANNSGATLHGLSTIVTDTTQLTALMQVVTLIAQTVEADANKNRVVSWDVINEPEWAITGSDTYGDPAFTPTSGYDTVTFAQMQTFVEAVVTALHASSSAKVTVGSAAIKWPKAWTGVGLDYYTVHMYDWINQYYPYNTPLTSYGLTGKPVVMGEFPLNGLSAVNGNPAVSYDTLVSTIFESSVGYGGAMPWAVNDTTDACCDDWSTAKANVASFEATEACETAY